MLTHTAEDGATVFRHACKLGLEGIVSKRLTAPYRSGPSRDWIKVKNPDSPADAAGAREPAPFALQRKFVVACFLPQSEPHRLQIFARRDCGKWFFNRTRSTMGAEGLGCSRQSIDCARRVRARLSMVVVHGCLSPM